MIAAPSVPDKVYRIADIRAAAWNYYRIVPVLGNSGSGVGLPATRFRQ
jgi:hypothetical protein